MTIQEAINNFYVHEQSPARRAEFGMFLQKYISKNGEGGQNLLPYKCTSKAAENIKKFLENLGLSDNDFAVKYSKLDPFVSTFEWKNAAAISKLVETLGLANTGTVLRQLGLENMRSFANNFSYANSVQLQSMTSTQEEVQPTLTANTTSEDTLSPLFKKTRDLINVLANIAEGVDDGLLNWYDQVMKPMSKKCKDNYGWDIPKNFWFTLLTACMYAKELKIVGEEEYPMILPLPMMEACVRAEIYMNKRPSVPAFARTPSTFYNSRNDWRSNWAYRIARMDEDVPAMAFIQAPLAEYMLPYPSPVLGKYLEHAQRDLTGLNLRDKAGIYVWENAPIIFNPTEMYTAIRYYSAAYDELDTSEIDLIAPTALANDTDKFWSYVQELYERTYSGYNLVFPKGCMRIMLDAETWHNLDLQPQCLEEAHNAERISRFDATTGANRHQVADYCVVLTAASKTDRAAVCNTKSRSALKYSITPTGESMGSKTSADYREAHLMPEELPYEWFTMTHAAVDKISTSDDDYRVRALQKLRANWRSLTTDSTYMGTTSCVESNSLYSTQAATLPLSAFISCSLPLALKLSCPDGLVFKQWGGLQAKKHSPDSIIAAVYSGMVTDSSPELSEVQRKEDLNGEFPFIRTCDFPKEGQPQASLSLNDNERMAQNMTNWLDWMAEDSTSQVKMTKRHNSGTSRTAWLVVETNISATHFLNSIRAQDNQCVHRLLTSFKNFLIGGTDVYAPTDERMNAYSYCMADCWEDMRCEVGRDLFNTAFTVQTNESGYTGFFPEDEGKYIRVGYRRDSYDRLILLFSVFSNPMQYARMVWRWMNRVQIVSASTMAKYNNVLNQTQVVHFRTGEEQKVDSPLWYLKRVAEHARTTGSRTITTAFPDVHGCYAISKDTTGTYSPDFRGTYEQVCPGCEPSREWFQSMEITKLLDYQHT